MARKHEFPDNGKHSGKAADREENYGDKAEARPRDRVVARAQDTDGQPPA